jgi:hypothetical protein
VFIIYGSVTSNMSSARLQLMTIKLDKDFFTLPEAYADYANVFNLNKAAKLQTQIYITHAINLEDEAKASYEPIYYFSELELRILRDYLAENEQRRWIRRFKSLTEALILFMPKSDKDLRFYVNYRALNKLTVKNRHALLLIDETINRLSGTKIYTKLDLKDAYYRIRMKAGNE